MYSSLLHRETAPKNSLLILNDVNAFLLFLSGIYAWRNKSYALDIGVNDVVLAFRAETTNAVVESMICQCR